MIKEKLILIIFDVDQTITKKDFFEYLINAFLTNDEKSCSPIKYSAPSFILSTSKHLQY